MVGAEKITIADIAKRLGVSKSTVSRAISGKGRIGEETRKKILDCIQEYNYIPNPVARALAGSRTYNIAVVIPKDADSSEIPFFQECLISVAETATEHGYDTVVAIESPDDISALQRLVLNHKVDGLIETRLSGDGKALSFLEESEVPFVVIGTSADDVVQIDTDQEKACYELMKGLLKDGTKNLVLLAGDETHEVNQRRYHGFSRALQESGGTRLLKEVWNLGSASEVLASLPDVLSLGPCCIVCMDDVICTPVIDYLDHVGEDEKKDVALVSLYGRKEIAKNDALLKSVFVDERSLCSRAAMLLIDLIEGREVPVRTSLEYDIMGAPVL